MQTRNTLPFLALFSLLFMGCNQSSNHPFGNCVGNSTASDDTTRAATNNPGRGALLGKRFSSLEDLKTVIQIEYDSNVVFVRHCSNGREVTRVLKKGASQGDILNARYKGAIWKPRALQSFLLVSVIRLLPSLVLSTAVFTTE